MDISSIMDDPPTPTYRSSGAYTDSSARQSIINSETGSHSYVLDPENSLKSPAFVLQPLSQEKWKDATENHEWRRSDERQPITRPSPEKRRHSGRVKREGHQRSEKRKEIGDDLIYQDRATWTKENDKILMGPFDYIDGQPGKDIRSQLIASFNAWLRVPGESLAVITKVVGMLHNASLLLAPSCDLASLPRLIKIELTT